MAAPEEIPAKIPSSLAVVFWLWSLHPHENLNYLINNLLVENLWGQNLHQYLESYAARLYLLTKPVSPWAQLQLL